MRSAGLDVVVRERGRAPGGRLASPQLHDRSVDLGASYFTVTDRDFAAVAADWRERGVASEWTDTFAAIDANGHSSKSGPMRWAAPGGLRTLARDLLGEVELGTEVTELPAGFDAVVLATPDPQAARLVPDGSVGWVDYDPVIAVAVGCAQRTWDFEAAFVNDDPDLTFIADDGARRGDGAPVLVVHTTPERARQHLTEPDGAVAPALTALRRVLGAELVPTWTQAHRWTFAKPAGKHDEPFWFDGRLGVCGDSWCPDGSPRVESAWLSGHRLGTELAARL